MAARMYWLVRTVDDSHEHAHALAMQVREAVQAIDPDVAASSIQPLANIVESSLGAWRVNVRLLQVFGQIAIVLCAIGVYAVAAFSAGMRRRELAIRAAFGARRRDLIAAVLRDEMRPVVFGLLLGICAALVTMPYLDALLFGTSPVDVMTYVLVGTAMLTLGTLACCLPAVRTGTADRAEILRV